ncbi:MAG: response regulator [Balneolaceae bacterium]|nr:response regulator [Balneolaceae bacterium]
MNTKRKVLIVEDEMIIALMIEQMITRLGHVVLDKVTTGEAAVEAALATSPDLILMDIRLGGKIDGIEAMQQIRKRKNIPVIYISGNTDRIDKNNLQQNGNTVFLTKPISYQALNKTVGVAS